jgi:O-antigen/teichoic acid export membrane protein
MTALARANRFFAPKILQIAHFASKQGIAVVGNLLYGLLCVRMLPVADYAKFAVLFGYMGSLTVLLDVGVAGTLAPLVGGQIANLPLIANYVASLRQIILRLYLVVAPLAILGFVFLVRKQHWGAAVVAQMLAALLATAWFARVSSSYGAVLILRRDRSRYYRIQILASLGSLGLLLVLWLLHWMNLYVAVLLNVAQVIFLATSYYRRARQLLGVKGRAIAQQRKAIIRLAMPNVPGSIFYATQGQITLMLITLFGHNASSVASVGALARLGQILVFVAQMNPILVEPFFAKLEAGRLKRTYLLTTAIVVVCSAAYSGLAFAFPEAFLWVLGPKYSQLRLEVSLAILASAMHYVAGFMWVIHSSRRFVYWWSNVSQIVLTLIVQAILIWRMDLSTVRNVLLFYIIAGTVTMLVTAAVGVYGFTRGPQKLEHISA